jgi:predicted negative regulator of RcsB-dependent stress response
MAFEEYDKYEQSELVQKWLRENGLSIVVGVAIGLVGIFGWQHWRSHQANHEAEAAQLYQQVQIALASGKPDIATPLVDQLMTDYAKSSYAVFAVSDRARQQVQDKQELRGDVLVKLGRPDDALKAYQAAVKAMGPEAQQGNEVQMKIDDLATAGKQGA